MISYFSSIYSSLKTTNQENESNLFNLEILQLTDEEKKHAYYKLCLKFQTPEYIAYVPKHLENYIKKKDIYNIADSPLEKEARRLHWSGPEHIREACIFRQNHPYEAMKMDEISQNAETMETINNPIWAQLEPKIINNSALLKNQSNKQFFLKILFPNSLIFSLIATISLVTVAIFLIIKKHHSKIH